MLSYDRDNSKYLGFGWRLNLKEVLMTAKHFTTYRRTATLYFILGLGFVLFGNTGVGLVFTLLGVSLLARTTEQVDTLAQNRSMLVWIPFLVILFISLIVVVIELVIPLV